MHPSHSPSRNLLSPHFLALFLCLLPAIAVAADDHWPQPFEASYAVRTSGIAVGTMTRRLALDADGSYRFESVVESTGLAALLKPLKIEETSTGRWKDGELRPLRYAYGRVSGKKSRQTVIEFDWDNARAKASVGSVTAEAELIPGTVDKLAYQLVLMRDLEAGRTELDYRVADTGKLKEYTLARLPEASVQAGDRTYATVPVAYSRDDGRRTVLWCAGELGYLPVRIEYTEKDGAVTTATLRATR